MDKWQHYYAIAEQCELEAAEAKRGQTRDILLEAASQWRRLGDSAKPNASKATLRAETKGGGEEHG